MKRLMCLVAVAVLFCSTANAGFLKAVKCAPACEPAACEAVEAAPACDAVCAPKCGLKKFAGFKKFACLKGKLCKPACAAPACEAVEAACEPACAPKCKKFSFNFNFKKFRKGCAPACEAVEPACEAAEPRRACRYDVARLKRPDFRLCQCA